VKGKDVKEVVVDYFMALSQDLHLGLEENYNENLG
jgi:hypothetical protein